MTTPPTCSTEADNQTDDAELRKIAQEFAYEILGDMGLSEDDYGPIISAYMTAYQLGRAQILETGEAGFVTRADADDIEMGTAMHIAWHFQEDERRVVPATLIIGGKE